MKITAKEVAVLRSATGLGMMDCRAALVKSSGDIEKAKIILRQQFNIKQRPNKATSEGHVGHYIHAGGKIGVLVEVNCETDFVAKNADFQSFVHDLAVHVAATNPGWLTRDKVPTKIINQEREVASAKLEGKPDNIIEKIIDGRLDKFYKGTCLMEQPYIKDQNVTINDLLIAMSAKTGENLVIKRFIRFGVGT